jgi:hypothetical protein
MVFDLSGKEYCWQKLRIQQKIKTSKLTKEGMIFMKNFVTSKVDALRQSNNNLDSRFGVKAYYKPCINYRRPSNPYFKNINYFTLIKTANKAVAEEIINIIADNWTEMFKFGCLYMFCDDEYFYLTFAHNEDDPIVGYYVKRNRMIVFLEKHGCNLDLLEYKVKEAYFRSKEEKITEVIMRWLRPGSNVKEDDILAALGY